MRLEMQKSYAVTQNLKYEVGDGKKLTELSVSDTVTSISIKGIVGGSDVIGGVRFGNGVEWIGDGCFANNDSKIEITNADGIRHIGKQSFFGCPGDENDLLDGKHLLFSIDDMAFANSGLKTASISLSGYQATDEDLDVCRSTEQQTGPYLGAYAFRGCASLADVSFVNSNEIGDWMFMDCQSLSGVRFTRNLGSCVGTGAFQNCTGLREISFPSRFKLFSPDMFNGCQNLSSVSVDEPSESELSDGTAFMCIQDRAFFGCQSLSEIVIPKGITSLEAFDQNSFFGSSIGKITLNGITRERLLQYANISSTTPPSASYST